MSSFVGQGSGASQSIAEGKAQKMMYDRQAEATIIEAGLAQEQIGEEKQAYLGHERTLYAKAGVDISEGSPLLMMEETAKRGELAKERIMWQAKNKYRQLKWAGRLAEKGGNMAAVTEAAKTAATIVSMAVGGFAAGGAGAAAGSTMAGAGTGSGGSGLNWSFNSFLRNYK